MDGGSQSACGRGPLGVSLGRSDGGPAQSPAAPRLSSQWLVGFSVFLFPGAAFSLRSRYRPQHIFFGAAIFLLSVGTALLGLKEALLFKLG